jgi:hypothetical protein
VLCAGFCEPNYNVHYVTQLPPLCASPCGSLPLLALCVGFVRNGNVLHCARVKGAPALCVDWVGRCCECMALWALCVGLATGTNGSAGKREGCALGCSIF